jgi:hypothetical protein
VLTSWQRWLLNAAALLAAGFLLTIWRNLDQEFGIRLGLVLTAGRYLLFFVALKWFFGWTKRRWQAHESAMAEAGRTGTSQTNSPQIQSPRSVPGRIRRSTPLLIGIPTAAVLVGAFYWYEYRPSQIRAECERLAIEVAQRTLRERAEMYPLDVRLSAAAARELYFSEDKNQYYVTCTRRRGLKDR